MNATDTPVLVVITYLRAAAQGRELDFAIAGWRKHFRHRNYKIIIVGENLPKIDGNDVVLIESKRVPQPVMQYWGHVDYVSCLRKVHKVFPESKGFILVADDCYAVHDFSLAEVQMLKYLPGGIDYDPFSSNGWRRDKMKTKRLLESMGLPARNFTTHLPIWYEWGMIESLWDRFGMDHQSFVIEDLYHNIYFPVAPAIAIDEDDAWKCGVFSDRVTFQRLHRATAEKVWITNDPNGYCPTLERFLGQYYGITTN